MNKKFLLAAMALPMLFTACSQDEYLEDSSRTGIDVPEARGFDLDLNPVLGMDAESRAVWDEVGGKLTWEANKDLISVYWLANQDGESEALKGNFNSIFKTNNGEAFTSESLVFEGGNIAVFPGDTEYTKVDEIKLKVPYSQDKNVILNVPYMSNYLSIEAENAQTEQLPGYNKGLYAPMKLAANVLYLDINLAGTTGLSTYGFKVDSVSLVSGANVFANSAVIKTQADVTVNDQNKVTYKNANGEATEKATITASTTVSATATQKVLTSTYVEKVSEGKYHAKFVVLPTGTNQASAVTANAKIIIYTNCGRIELQSTELAANAQEETKPTAKYEWSTVAEDAEAPTYEGVVTGKTEVKNEQQVAVNQTIAGLIAEISSNQVASSNSNFKGEFIGKPMKRAISADMANATLNNSYVYSSDDIKKYIAIHTAMASEEPMNLVLASKEGNKQFKSLTAEALALVDGKNKYATAEDSRKNIVVTLSAYDGGNQVVDSVWVSTVGNVYAPVAEAWSGDAAKWILARNEGWTMNDTYAPATSVVSQIINYGTLTIAGTVNDSGQNILTPALKNEGTIKIGGNGKLYLDGDFVLGGSSTIDVAAGQTLRFAENMASGHDFQGTINVAADAFLTVANGVSVHSAAKVNNAGTLGSAGTSGGYYNEGTITVTGEQATTLVQDNSKGTIKMYNRTDAIKVENTDDLGEIIYTYTTSDPADFTKTATDKFTTVEFGSEIKTVNLTYNNASLDAIKNVNLTFNGAGTVVLNATSTGNWADKNVEINTLKVGKYTHLKVNPDNKLYVQSVVNEGTITAAGNIYYYENYTDKGEVITTGGGSIAPADNVALQNNITSQLKAALADGSAGTASNPVEISLTEDTQLSETLTFDGVTTMSRAAAARVYVVLDLAGSTITSSAQYAVKVAEGFCVTIKNGYIVSRNNTNSGYAVLNYGETILDNVDVTGSLCNLKTMTVTGCKVTTEVENHNAIISGYNNQDTSCFLTLKDSRFTSKTHAAAKLQWNYIGLDSQGLYTIEGTTFTGKNEDLCLAGAKIEWGDGNVLTNDKVHIFNNYISLINGKETVTGSTTCSWESVFATKAE